MKHSSGNLSSNPWAWQDASQARGMEREQQAKSHLPWTQVRTIQNFRGTQLCDRGKFYKILGSLWTRPHLVSLGLERLSHQDIHPQQILTCKSLPPILTFSALWSHSSFDLLTPSHLMSSWKKMSPVIFLSQLPLPLWRLHNIYGNLWK